MISEGSCDTEHWSYDAENSDLINIKTAILNCNNIWKRIQYFWSNKCSL